MYICLYIRKGENERMNGEGERERERGNPNTNLLGRYEVRTWWSWVLNYVIVRIVRKVRGVKLFIFILGLGYARKLFHLLPRDLTARLLLCYYKNLATSLHSCEGFSSVVLRSSSQPLHLHFSLSLSLFLLVSQGESTHNNEDFQSWRFFYSPTARSFAS